MASCFSDAEPINPINQLLADVFGDNYLPPYSAAVQPVKQKDMNNDKLLQWSFPGGGKGKPPSNPQMQSIKDMIAPMTSALSQAFVFLGPVFVIIDVIRGIIDVICALLNPIPLAAAVIQLLTNVLPPLIALYPAFAMVLMAINMAKLVTSILVSMLAAIIPIIELIVRNALSISDLVTLGNMSAIDGVTIKICTLLQHLDDQFSALTPLALIFEIFDIFAKMGSQLPCTPGSDCCDSSNCPAFVVNPATGRAKVIVSDDQEIPRTLLGPVIADFLNIRPYSVIELTSATSSANPLGIVSQKGVGATYSKSELLDGAKYVVDPQKLPAPAKKGPSNGPDEPYTLALRMVSGNAVKTGRIRAIRQSRGNSSRVEVEIDRMDFDVGTNIDYTIVPDMNTLLGQSMIGLGCVNEVQLASRSLQQTTNAGGGTGGGGDGQGTASFEDKMGGDQFPDIPQEEWDDLYGQIVADPTSDITEKVQESILGYLSRVAEYHDSVLCIGASRLKSDFSISKTVVVADGVDSATISLTVREQGGAAILTNLLPNSTAKAEFYSTHGDIGPVVLDDQTGTFSATITGKDLGQAEISAAFLVNDSPCMIPGFFDGFSVNEKILSLKFIPVEEKFARSRPVNQYVQSGRGKRR